MNAKNPNFVKLTEITLWSMLAILLSLLIVSRSWVVAALIPASLVGFLLLQAMPRQLLMLLLVGIPNVFVYINNWLMGIPFMRVERAIVVALLAALISRTLLYRRHIVPMISAEKAMIGVLLIFGVSLLVKNVAQPWSVSKESIVLYINGFVLPYSIFFLVRRVQWSASDFDRLLILLAASGVYLTICGALQYYLQIDFFYPRYEDLPVAGRASGPFRNSGEFGMVMGAMAILALYRFSDAQSQAPRFFWALLIVLFGFAVAISSTRNAWVALTVALTYLFFVEPKCRKLLAMLGTGGAISVAVWVAFSQIGGDFSERVGDVSTLYPRISAYTTAINITSQNPLFGLGFGRFTFYDAKAEYATTFGLIGPQWTVYAGVPHNEYLHILVLTGMTGLAAIIWLWRSVYQAICAARDAGRPQGWRNRFLPYCKAIVLLYLVSGLLVDTIFFRYYLSVLFFLCGMVAARPAKHEQAIDR